MKTGRPVPGRKTENALLLNVYRLALTTRAVDERLWILARQGMVSFVLTARGHEIAQIAAALAFRPRHDSAWLYYRDMAAGFAWGATPYELFLGGLGRAADPHSGGRQLTTHLSSPTLRIGSPSSGVAAQLPLAVGAAYAARVLGEDAVALCSFGDGAASEGATHEAMNLAGVRQLPVVFFCQNNGIAISVPTSLQMPIQRVAERAAAYGMPGVTVDGTDTLAVYQAARDAVARARKGDGPSLVEVMVPRITSHSSQDDDAYRGEAERESARRADPIPRLRQDLLERGLLSEAEDAELVRLTHERVTADADRALAQPEPEPSRARRWLYAGDPPHPALAEAAAQGGRARVGP